MNAPSKADTLNSALSHQTINFRNASPIKDYRIGPEDLIEIETFQVQDLKSTVRVSAQGFIKLPLVDKIHAAGLSVAELETLIATKLKKYVQEPVVSVFIKDYRSQQILVLGSVKDPRVYYATGQKYLLDILSMAGGLTPEAGNICIIQRVTQKGQVEGDFVEKTVIDLDELLINGRIELNVPMHGGDVVQIPQSGIFFVDGAVLSPGEFRLKSKTTLTQAISMAKGLHRTATSSDIKIFRDKGAEGREIINVDYDSILAGTANDIPIQEKDIIIVASSGFKRFLNTLTGSFGYGLFSVGAKPF